MSSPAKKHLVIIGAGYAGITAAKKLKGTFDITIINPRDYFQHIMAVYHCVSDPRHYVKVRKSILQCVPGAKLHLGEVQHVSKTHVTLKDGSTVAFDYLVILQTNPDRPAFL